MSIFNQYFNFWPTFELSTKMLILDQNIFRHFPDNSSDLFLIVFGGDFLNLLDQFLDFKIKVNFHMNKKIVVGQKITIWNI